MGDTMSLVDLAAQLRLSLRDSASAFTLPNDEDMKRFLLLALPDMQAKRPVTRLASILLEAGRARYSLAAYPDFAAYKTNLWSDPALLPACWDPGYPGAIPRVSADWDGAVWWLAFESAPSALHLAALGNMFSLYYFARHELGEVAEDTTIASSDRGLLLLRAQAEAMRELAIRNMNKPVQMRDGLSGTPRNSTPAALHEQLLRLFRETR